MVWIIDGAVDEENIGGQIDHQSIDFVMAVDRSDTLDPDPDYTMDHSAHMHGTPTMPRCKMYMIW